MVLVYDDYLMDVGVILFTNKAFVQVSDFLLTFLRLSWGISRQKYIFFVVIFYDSTLPTATEGFIMFSRSKLWELVTASKGLQHTIFTGCYRVPEAIILEKPTP